MLRWWERRRLPEREMPRRRNLSSGPGIPIFSRHIDPRRRPISHLTGNQEKIAVSGNWVNLFLSVLVLLQPLPGRGKPSSPRRAAGFLPAPVAAPPALPDRVGPGLGHRGQSLLHQDRRRARGPRKLPLRQHRFARRRVAHSLGRPAVGIERGGGPQRDRISPRRARCACANSAARAASGNYTPR